MPDSIKKFLAKLSPNDKEVVADLIERVINDNLIGLQIKKLAGHSDVFRVRKGKFRVIYKKINSVNIIIFVGRRDESTYRDF